MTKQMNKVLLISFATVTVLGCRVIGGPMCPTWEEFEARIDHDGVTCVLVETEDRTIFIHNSATNASDLAFPPNSSLRPMNLQAVKISFVQLPWSYGAVPSVEWGDPGVPSKKNSVNVHAVSWRSASEYWRKSRSPDVDLERFKGAR